MDENTVTEVMLDERDALAATGFLLTGHACELENSSVRLIRSPYRPTMYADTNEYGTVTVINLARCDVAFQAPASLMVTPHEEAYEHDWKSLLPLI